MGKTNCSDYVLSCLKVFDKEASYGNIKSNVSGMGRCCRVDVEGRISDSTILAVRMTGCKEGAPKDVTGGSRGGSAKTCKPPPEETCKGAALPRTVCSSEVLSAVHIRWRDGRLDESVNE